MSKAESPSDALDTSTRLDLAEQCRSVTLSTHGESLVDAAVELHLAGNAGSNERFDTNQSYRERAEMGYRAEVAVAEHYGLVPEIDYRPPKVGDAGHDFRVRLDGETLTVDVKATRTVPPTLYLTKKRAESDRYQLPDAYLLCATELPSASDGESVHLVGWIRADDLRERGEETTVNGNPVWRLDGLELSPPPARRAVEPLPSLRREVWAAADRAGLETSGERVDRCAAVLSGGESDE